MMSRWGLWALVLVLHCMAISPPVGAESAEAKGTKIAKKVYNRPTGKDSVALAQMVLQPKKGESRMREFYMYQRRPKKNQLASLVRFLQPASVKDVGLLTLDDEGDDSDQWIFLSAAGRARRISSKRQGGRFANSDLFYEDMRDREVSMDKHTYLGQEEVNGVKLLKIKSVPVKASNSVYSYRMTWVHPESWVPIKAESYKKGRKEPWKRSQVYKLEKIDGIWTVLDSVVEDLKEGSKTRVVLKKIKYNNKLPESLFTQKVLEDPSRETTYRKL